VLASVGAVLRHSGRAFDLVSRIGGDEFAVLLPDTDVPSALAVAERIRRDLPSAVEVPVTLSIGVGGLDRSMPTTEHLLDDADFAPVKSSGAAGAPSPSTTRARRPLPSEPRPAPQGFGT
jgi:diguanylate cyclase (GGDEF)-like protein